MKNTNKIIGLISVFMLIGCGGVAGINTVKNGIFEDGNVNNWHVHGAGDFSFYVITPPANTYAGVYSAGMSTSNSAGHALPDTNYITYVHSGAKNRYDLGIYNLNYISFYARSDSFGGCYAYVTLLNGFNQTLATYSWTPTSNWSQFLLTLNASEKTYTKYFDVEFSLHNGHNFFIDNLIIDVVPVSCNTSADCGDGFFCLKATNTCEAKIANLGSCGLAVECDEVIDCDISCISNNSLYGVCVNQANCSTVKSSYDNEFKSLIVKNKYGNSIDHIFFKEWNNDINKTFINETILNNDSGNLHWLYFQSNSWEYMSFTDYLSEIFDYTSEITYYGDIKFTQTNYLDGYYINYVKLYNDTCELYNIEQAYHFKQCTSWLIFDDFCFKYDNLWYSGKFWNTTDINNFTSEYPFANNTNYIKYVLIIPKLSEETQAWTRIIINKTTGQEVYRNTVNCTQIDLLGSDYWECINYANFTGFNDNDSYNLVDIFRSFNGAGKVVRNGEMRVINITYNGSEWKGFPIDKLGNKLNNESVGMGDLDKDNTYWFGTGNITQRSESQDVGSSGANNLSYLLLVFLAVVLIYVFANLKGGISTVRRKK